MRTICPHRHYPRYRLMLTEKLCKGSGEIVCLDIQIFSIRLVDTPNIVYL